MKNFWQSYPASLEVRHATATSRRPPRVALVARSAGDGPAPLRHPGARSGFQLRRRAARLQHAARRGAHQRADALPHRRRAHRRRRPRRTPGSRSSRRCWRRRPSTYTPPESSASGACPTAPRRQEGARRPARRGLRLLSQGSRAAALVRLLEFRRRDAPARWRAPRVALRHRRLRLGQHRTRHRHVALVHLPAHRPRRRLPHGRGDDAPHQRSRHAITWAASPGSARATTCATGAAAPRKRASARPRTGASTTT